ncbi:endonuclease I family protein [Myroides odoratus]
MRKQFLFALLASLILGFGCTRDSVLSLDDLEKPTKPGVEKPEDGGNDDDDDGGTPPVEGEAGIDKNEPNFVANFNNWSGFVQSLNKYKLVTYAIEAQGQGKTGSALHLNGTPDKNDYVFTVENQTVNPNAKFISFWMKGTSAKSLSFNVFKQDGSYDVFNLKSDADINDKKTVVITSNVVLQKTARMQASNPKNGNNDYTNLTVNSPGQWIKVTLDLTNVDYNKSGKGSVFALKVGSNALYNLYIDSIVFETSSTDPEVPGGEDNGDYNIPSAISDYYKTVDFSKDGMALKAQLTTLTKAKHVNFLTYAKVWDALKETDLTPAKNEVYLLYGHAGVLTGKTAYTRGKNKNGGAATDWNREHTYAKSLGTPNLGETGPGSDAHHLRPADPAWNSTRGNKLFSKGSGVSGASGSGWYPGDEWKGDVARMMMYMYIRYEDRCLPSNVAIGTTNSVDRNMIQLLLEWNAEDPVSPLEIQRNEYLGNQANEYGQGNRNPFIDNPNLATKIWGGPTAENKWKK